MAKILIIEDEQDIRDNLVKILTYEGFETLGAENGRVGIGLAKKMLPDVIICDIAMPEADGYEVLLDLRKFPSTATIPFIFLTAKTEDRDMRKGMQLGADDYLKKPFTVDDLLSTIQTRLQKHAFLEDQASQSLEELRFSLSSSLPHEMRTPLTGITGFAQLLIHLGPEALPPPEEVIEMQEGILENALRLQHLVENYLLYAKLKLMEYESDAQKVWEQDIGLYPTQTLLTWTAQQKAESSERQHDLTLELIKDEVILSEHVLQKITQELLDNAFKFSSPGTPVRVATYFEGEDFILSITDHGRGMSKENMKQIGAFRQFDREQYEQQGSGLGLIIVRLLAQQHGAECLIESEPEQGTTVSIVFHQPGTETRET